MRKVIWIGAIVGVLVGLRGARAEEGAPLPVGIVSHVNVVSNSVADVSSLEAWKKSTIKEGMTDQEKAIAVFRTVVGFEHEVDSPMEFVQFGGPVADAIKTFNVYGYNLCGPGASHVVELARYAGMQSRGWNIQGHTVAEIFYGGAWHMFDASYINYFPKEDGVVASVAEIMADVKAWYEKNPGYKGQAEKLAELRKSEGFAGWKTKGPGLLARCPFYSERGFLPAGLMDWHHTMRQYDGTVSFEYENGYSMGYQVNVQLRPGEKLIRNWSHRDLHINVLWEGKAAWLKLAPGEGAMKYTREFGDLAPGRVGNGVLDYVVPVGDAALAASALRYENLRVRAEGETGPVLTVKDPEKEGVLEIRVASPYVLLSGVAAVKAVVPEKTGITAGLSDNNGRDWMELPIEKSMDDLLTLSKMVHRRYEYRLRFVIKGKGAGLDSLRLGHDVQQSQRALPILVSGENTIHVSSGPAEGTVTVEPSLNSKAQPMQVVYTDFGAKLEGIEEREGGVLGVLKEKGTVVFPIETPGDMKRLRVFSFYRARDAKDGWEVEASFDEGKTWVKAGALEGGKNFGGSSFVVEKAPAGARKALVRWTGTQANAALLFNLRIDADYAEPHGGYRPVKVTYVWEEGGVEKKDVHVAKTADETYMIKCGEKVTCKSVVVELAE